MNFYGVLTGCRLVLPEMVKRRSGHIVNIASMAGMVAVPGQVVYAGTKFAVVGLSTAMADEFAPQGVEVTVILPTFTNTELIAGTKATGAQKPVQPEDIAAAIVKALDKPRPTSRCRLRCGSSAPSRRCWARAGGAGCPSRWATTACSSTSTRRRATERYEDRARRRCHRSHRQQ